MSSRVFGRVWPLATSLGNRTRTQRPLEEAICNRDTGFAFPSTDTCNEVKNESPGYCTISNTGAEANCKKGHWKQEILISLHSQALLHISKTSWQVMWSFSQHYCAQATLWHIPTRESIPLSHFPLIAELVEDIRNIFESTSAQSHPLYKCVWQIYCLAVAYTNDCGVNKFPVKIMAKLGFINYFKPVWYITHVNVQAEEEFCFLVVPMSFWT